VALGNAAREKHIGLTQPHYVSADSTPPSFAVTRQARVVSSLLLSVGLLSAAVTLILHDLILFYAHILETLTGVPLADRLGEGSLGLRPYFLAFLLLLSCFAVGSLRQRLSAPNITAERSASRSERTRGRETPDGCRLGAHSVL
jgi:hypothetical protein